jgi:hypothetical protein
MFDVLVGRDFSHSAFYIIISRLPISKTSAGFFLFFLSRFTFLFNSQWVDYLSFSVNAMGGLVQNRVLVSGTGWVQTRKAFCTASKAN